VLGRNDGWTLLAVGMTVGRYGRLGHWGGFDKRVVRSRLYLILNGGLHFWGDAIDDNQLPCAFEVDYVRVYKEKRLDCWTSLRGNGILRRILIIVISPMLGSVHEENNRRSTTD